MDDRCEPVRETLSAWLDGEDGVVSPDVATRHLEVCTGCRGYQGALVGAQRRLRVRPAMVVPDLSEPILVADAARRERALRARAARGLVGVVGLVQLTLAVPLLLGVVEPELHLARHLGALELGLGVGLLVAALQPRRAAGVLPIAAVVATVSVVSAALEIQRGHTTLLAESVHLLEAVAVLGLWLLVRVVGAGAGARRGAWPAAATSS